MPAYEMPLRLSLQIIVKNQNELP